MYNTVFVSCLIAVCLIALFTAYMSIYCVTGQIIAKLTQRNPNIVEMKGKYYIQAFDGFEKVFLTRYCHIWLPESYISSLASFDSVTEAIEFFNKSKNREIAEKYKVVGKVKELT